MKRRSIIGVILTITFSTLFVEILLTRILSVVYFGHTAFLIISLALFGYGLSGVFLSVSRLVKSEKAFQYLEWFLFAFAVSLPVIYKLVLMLRIDFLHLFHPLQNFVFLVLTFLLLILPFFFAGISLSLIFSVYAAQIGRLYFVDLAGAALGALAVIPLVPLLGPTRLLLVMSLFLAFCWYLISSTGRWKKNALLLLAVGGFFVLFRISENFFPIVPVESEAEKKRYFPIQRKNKRIELSRWSTINKIDVAPWPFQPPTKVIWINGGTMQSYIHQFDGNLRALSPILWDPNALPYQMADRKGSALVIGSAGGYEVLCALSNGFKSVVAVEMDPVICSVLKKEYALYSGNLFLLPQVKLLADEGRSVVQRMHMKFDVIQMVNSHNSDELLSGALSVSETYIFTVEAFKDYWRRLNDNGFVYIIHWMSERLFTTALQALRELGIPDPEKRFFIIQKRYWFANENRWRDGFVHFVMKKGYFTPADLSILHDVSSEEEVVYTPEKEKSNFFYEIVHNTPAAIRSSAVSIAPVRDHSPYLYQTNKIGQMGFANMKISGSARELVIPNMVFSNSIYLSILALSLLFSFLFIYLPLKLRGGRSAFHPLIPYFFLIGGGFITVEIIAIKIFQLFLGSPAVSISVIIFALLVSSGIGSLFSEKVAGKKEGTMIPVFALLVAVILGVYALFLFKMLNAFLHLRFFGRVCVTLVLLFIPGFLMGQFFPYGIRTLGKAGKEKIGWAWGANAFATVLGSILTVIVSINWSFAVALFMAAIFYFLSGAIVWRQNHTGRL